LLDFKELISQEFLDYQVKGKDSKGYDVIKSLQGHKQNGSQKNEVVEWLTSIGCFEKKSIPECILRGSKAEVAAFLSRLFACDGCTSVKNGKDKSHSLSSVEIGYCSSSWDLIQGVRHLLLKFGIHCSIRDRKIMLDGKEHQSYSLSICMSESVCRFAEEIGIFGKEDALDKVSVVNQRNDMAFSDVAWDEVEAVEFAGELETIDLTVEGTNIIGGDIISHNSTMAACMSNYEMYKLIKRGDPSAYYGFPPETNISITNVAPTDDQAGVVFNMILGQAMNCPFLRDRSINQTQTYFNLRTDADMKSLAKRKRASITSLAGGCASNSLRGRNNITIILDEMAFFIDNNGRFSGGEVYRALTPSTATFEGDGKIICISSPRAKYGAFYDRFSQSVDEKDSTLMFQMYSAMCNPNVDSMHLKNERRRDRSGFMCEYGGEFSDTITAWIDDEPSFKACLSERVGRSRGDVGVPYFMGIDLGLKNDGTAVVIVHRDDETKKIFLDYAEVWYSASSDVWESESSIYSDCRHFAHRDVIQVSEVAKEIGRLCLWFPTKSGWFDQYNGYSLHEQLHNMGLNQFKMEQVTDVLNNKVYQLLKMLLMDKLIDMFNHPVLVSEMLMLEAERKARNKVQVRAPSRRGAHDDMSDAFARAVWECYQHYQTKSIDNITSLVGGGRSVTSRDVASSSLDAFRLQRMKAHGVNIRNISQNRRAKRSF